MTIVIGAVGTEHESRGIVHVAGANTPVEPSLRAVVIIGAIGVAVANRGECPISRHCAGTMHITMIVVIRRVACVAVEVLVVGQVQRRGEGEHSGIARRGAAVGGDVDLVAGSSCEAGDIGVVGVDRHGAIGAAIGGSETVLHGEAGGAAGGVPGNHGSVGATDVAVGQIFGSCAGGALGHTDIVEVCKVVTGVRRVGRSHLTESNVIGSAWVETAVVDREVVGYMFIGDHMGQLDKRYESCAVGKAGGYTELAVAEGNLIVVIAAVVAVVELNIEVGDMLRERREHRNMDLVVSDGGAIGLEDKALAAVASDVAATGTVIKEGVGVGRRTGGSGVGLRE